MSKPRTLPLVIFAASLVLIAALVQAQTNSTNDGTSPRDLLIQLIKENAREDARSHRPRQSVQDLQLLFGRKADEVGLTLLEVKTDYDVAYSKETAESSWIERVRPEAGWIVAAISVLLLFIGDALKRTFSRRFKKFSKAVSNWLAGYSFFQRRGLRKYRAALVQRYSKFKLPFRSDVELSMASIYVPLKVVGAASTDQMDSLKVLANYRHLVICGVPGAGKSILLKRLALFYAVNQLKSSFESPTVVLFELRRLNESDKPLIDHLVDNFALHGFVKAEPYIRRSLLRGKLMILLDGLDEVAAGKRPQSIAQIADLLQRYDECRVVITCRTAVYKGQLDAHVDQRLEIVEFTDQQVRRFLSSWPGLPAQKSIEQLVITLKERPRIMALARNPLLLTMIAFLYSYVDEFVLPHSRAEFYGQAVDVLLSKLKWEHNRYKASHKQLILEHLALFNQKKATGSEEDRLSIDLKTIIRQMNSILPDLNVDPEHAIPLLDEIVERNGLMLAIDGGTRYQFSHLTLQEFFSALALMNQPQRVLEYFNTDRDAWREVVKLWCGFAQDSTDLIKSISELDPVTAFECLADAQSVNQDVAEEMVESFKEEFGLDPALTSAFAAVASGPTRRSQRVLQFMDEVLTSSTSDERRSAAITALSLSNKLEAAKILITHLDISHEALPALVQMGDVAISGLQAHAQKASRVAIKALGVIGTPDAARALVPLLWDSESVIRDYAALILGALFTDPVIVGALESDPVSMDHQEAPWLDWVWKPFNPQPDSSVAIIAGRIAELLPLTSVLSEDVSTWPIDERIVIPVVIETQQRLEITLKDIVTTREIRAALKGLIATNESDLNSMLRKPQLDLPSSIRGTTMQANPGAALAKGWEPAVFDPLFAFPSLHGKSSQLFQVLRHLKRSSQIKVLRVLLGSSRVSVKDWLRIAQPFEYAFSTSWHFLVIRLLTIGLVLLSVKEISLEYSESIHSWWPAWFMFWGCLLVASAFATLVLGKDFRVIAFEVTFAGVYSLFKVCLFNRLDFAQNETQSTVDGNAEITPKNRRRGGDLEIDDWFSLAVSAPFLLVLAVLVVIVMFVLLCIGPAVIYFSTHLLLRVLKPTTAYGLWSANFLAIAIIWGVALREHRRARNPLRSIINPRYLQADGSADQVPFK